MPRRERREARRERLYLRHGDDPLQERQTPEEDQRENESLHRLHQHLNGSPSHLVGVEPSTPLPVEKGDPVRHTRPVVGRDHATPAVHHHACTHPDAAICVVIRRARNAGVKVAVAAVVAVIPGAEGTAADVADITPLTAVKLENVLMLGHLDCLRSVGH